MNPKLQQFNGSAPQHEQLQNLATEWQGPTGFWTAASIVESLQHPQTKMWFVQESNTELWLGAILIRNTGDELELLYIHTALAARGRGIARQMLNEVLDELRQENISDPKKTKFFLEVRSSNTAAQKLYRSMNFIESGRRKKYYKDGEDALIFETTL